MQDFHSVLKELPIQQLITSKSKSTQRIFMCIFLAFSFLSLRVKLFFFVSFFFSSLSSGQHFSNLRNPCGKLGPRVLQSSSHPKDSVTYSHVHVQILTLSLFTYIKLLMCFLFFMHMTTLHYFCRKIILVSVSTSQNMHRSNISSEFFWGYVGKKCDHFHMWRSSTLL